MTVEVLEAPTGVDTDNELDHFACCCSPEISLCGLNGGTSEFAEIMGDEIWCVICWELADIVCPKCGYGSDGPCFCGKCHE